MPNNVLFLLCKSCNPVAIYDIENCFCDRSAYGLRFILKGYGTNLSTKPSQYIDLIPLL